LAASPLVEQLMVVGQDRKQLGLLLVPKAEALTAWATERGLKEPALARALTGEFNRLLSERPGARPDERLAGVALVEPFSIENGLLTQTLKQRRDRITARDGGAIEGIYGG
jgi:long-chain acyl-CoA synthetase